MPVPGGAAPAGEEYAALVAEIWPLDKLPAEAAPRAFEIWRSQVPPANGEKMRLENGNKRFAGAASCYPRIAAGGRAVQCPDHWTLSAEYHSHPGGLDEEYFSGGTGDYGSVNQTGGVPLYVGTPSSKVKRLDKDEKGNHKNDYHHSGVEIPDSWNFEQKWTEWRQSNGY